MERYVTISAKIPSALRAKMRKLGIKPSVAIRKAIDDAITERRIKELKAGLEEFREATAKVNVQDVVRDIREDRESR